MAIARRGLLGEKDNRAMIIEDVYEAKAYFKKLAEEEAKDQEGFFKKYFIVELNQMNKFLGNSHFIEDNGTIKKDIYYAWKYKFLQFEDLTEYSIASYVFNDIETWNKLKKTSKPLREFLKAWKEELELILKGKAFKVVIKDAKKNVSSAKYLLEGKYKDFIEDLSEKDNKQKNKEALEETLISDETILSDFAEIKNLVN
jgi:hypothetical protein